MQRTIRDDIGHGPNVFTRRIRKHANENASNLIGTVLCRSLVHKGSGSRVESMASDCRGSVLAIAAIKVECNYRVAFYRELVVRKRRTALSIVQVTTCS